MIRLLGHRDPYAPIWANIYNEMASEFAKIGIVVEPYDGRKLDGRDLLAMLEEHMDVLDIDRTPDEMNIFDLGFALAATHIAQLGPEILIKYNLISACNVYDLMGENHCDLFEMYHGFLREGRGTVVNMETKELVTAPFCKFANINEWTETKEANILKMIEKASVVEYSNKLDGSLVIARAINGKVRLFSSGNISEDIGIQIIWAKDHVTENLTQFLLDHSDYTCMFELIDHRDLHVVPINRPVGLYLLGMRDIRDGTLLHYYEVIQKAKDYNIFATHLFDKSFAEIMRMVKTESHNDIEGFVANIDGYRVKIKCEDYLAFQRVRNHFTHNDLIPLFLSESLDDAFSYMTEFDRNYYEGLMNELKEIRQKIIKYADDKVKENPTTTRKDFAFWVKENTHKMLTGFVISRYDGKEIEPFIRRNLPIRYVDFLEYKKCFE
jgi:hypothetical protein